MYESAGKSVQMSAFNNANGLGERRDDKAASIEIPSHMRRRCFMLFLSERIPRNRIPSVDPTISGANDEAFSVGCELREVHIPERTPPKQLTASPRVP